MKIDNNTGIVSYWGLPVLRDKENVEEPDYDADLF
jgi:hypothetical protein